MNYSKTGNLFLISSLFFLIVGLMFGFIGSLQYIVPGLFHSQLPFNKIRPLHVTLVTGWIISAAVAGVYYYLPERFLKQKLSEKIGLAHFIFWFSAVMLSILSYLAGIFGGREYMEYSPRLSPLFGIAWILFAINFFRSISRRSSAWPVYIWMWASGIIFFVLTYVESNLWLFSYFNVNIVRDITVQWKSMGSMVGAWNMLIYGTAIYLLECINRNDNTSRSRQSFALYFLGLTNLMFNWGHHTYNVPAASYIRNISYIISMTELLILGNIILGSRKTLKSALKNKHLLHHRFLISSDVWIFLNLILAILISIPAINGFTHGTHITVAHSMGATIGINSTILFASIFFILSETKKAIIRPQLVINFLRLFNFALFVFWISLIFAGVYKAKYLAADNANFSIIMGNLIPVFMIFSISGFVLLFSLVFFAVFAIKRLIRIIP